MKQVSIENLVEQQFRGTHEMYKGTLERLDSHDKLRDAILLGVREGGDSIGVSRYGIDGTIEGFYNWLRTNLDGVRDSSLPDNKKQRILGDLTERLDQFELAALSLIFDKGIFSVKPNMVIETQKANWLALC